MQRLMEVLQCLARFETSLRGARQRKQMTDFKQKIIPVFTTSSKCPWIRHLLFELDHQISIFKA